MVARNSSRPPGTKRPSIPAEGWTGDDVVLVTSPQHGRVGRVGHGRPHHPGDTAQPGQGFVGAIRIKIDIECLADGVKEGALGIGDLVWPFVAADPRNGGGELGDRVLIMPERTVAGPTLGDQVQPEQALFGSLDGIEPKIITQGEREAADFANGFRTSFDDLGMMVDQPVRAQHAARLLVGGEHQPNGTTRRHARAGSGPDDAQDHRVEVFHVYRAATPDAVVDDLPSERVDGPVVGMGRHDIQVAVDEQGRSVRSTPSGSQ